MYTEVDICRNYLGVKTPLLSQGRHNKGYTYLICLHFVVIIKLSSTPRLFCWCCAAESQDKAAKNYLQFSICIKKCKRIPAALESNIHGKEMLPARTFLEMTVPPGGDFMRLFQT